jgi:hypothetical protein
MYGQQSSTLRRFLEVTFLTACFFAVTAQGQVQVGDNLRMNLNGVLGTGYAGQWGNQSGFDQTSHGIFLQGQGDLSGSFYSPQFLNFNVRPFYNRNQDNSSFATVLNQSGVDAGVNLFSGSHFPGAANYYWSQNDGTQYGLYQSPGLVGNDTTQGFNVSWSALIPNWPTLTATYSTSSSSGSILGETGTTESRIKGLNLLSNYSIDGFNLGGGFIHQNFENTFPSFIGGPNLQSTSMNNGFFITASHSLPLNGAITGGYTRQTYENNTADVVNNGTADTLYATIGMTPVYKLSVTGGVRYYNNLVGGLQGSLLPAGSVPLVPFSSDSKGLALNGFANYNIGHGFLVGGYANWYQQHFQGIDYSNHQFGATLTYNYARPLLGMLYFTFGMVNNGYSGGQGGMAAVANIGLKKIIAGWDIEADASYSQNLQNSVAWFTTSSYNFGGSVRRQIGDFAYWSATARTVRTALTQLHGYDTHSEIYITTLTYKRTGLSGSYTQNSGTSILTTTGLVPIPVPGLQPGEVLYNGASYGGTLSYTPLKRLTTSVSWFRMNADTASNISSNGPIFSQNSSNRMYGVMTYRFRKLNFMATYWRTNQQVSSSGLGWVNQNNYTFTVSRWFNVF